MIIGLVKLSAGLGRLIGGEGIVAEIDGGYMGKQNQMITQAARTAAMASGQLVPSGGVFGAIEAASRKLVDAAQRSDEPAGSVVGIRIDNGCITDVLASNGAVWIER